MPEIHFADAGDQGDEGAYDRDEARQDECTVAIALEEDVGPDHVGLFEDLASQSRTRFEQRWTDLATDGVAAHIAQHRGNSQHDADERQVVRDHARRRQQPGSEQQRVARQDREEPALSEDDECHAPERVRSEEPDQFVGVHPGRQQHRHQRGSGLERGHVGKRYRRRL